MEENLFELSVHQVEPTETIPTVKYIIANSLENLIKLGKRFDTFFCALPSLP